MKELGSTSEENNLSEPKHRTKLEATAGDGVRTLAVVSADTESSEAAANRGALETLPIPVGHKALWGSTSSEVNADTPPESSESVSRGPLETLSIPAGHTALRCSTASEVNEDTPAEISKSVNRGSLETLPIPTGHIALHGSTLSEVNAASSVEVSEAVSPGALETLPIPAGPRALRGSTSGEDSSFLAPTRLKAKLPALTGVGQTSRITGDPLHPAGHHPGLLPPLSAKEGGGGGVGLGASFDSHPEPKHSPRGSRKVRARASTPRTGGGPHQQGRHADPDPAATTAVATAAELTGAKPSHGWKGVDSSVPPSPASSSEGDHEPSRHGKPDEPAGVSNRNEAGEPAGVSNRNEAGESAGVSGRNKETGKPSGKVSMKGSALAVVSAIKLKHNRRSSATMHTDLLRAFVPDMLINYLEGASKPLESHAFFVEAACMCADISGFTALSEKHCKEGTSGLDALVQIINSYYSNLVNIVYSFGGDIIKIAGDALYCIFMPDERDLRGAVLCAALCSMQLREVASDGLTLHVGISSGELCFGILGGIDNYWECLMSGDPIGLVADALDEAKKQQVVVSVECLAIIGDCCRGSPLPSRNVLLSSMHPPGREKRGSIRVAKMIANRGLPVELEPTQGVVEGTQQTPQCPAGELAPSELLASAGAASATVASASVAYSANEATDTSKLAQEGAGMGGKEEGEGTPRATTPSGSSKIESARGGGVGKREGEGDSRAVTPIGSPDNTEAGGTGGDQPRRSEFGLGEAGKMRADSSPGVLPLLQGFVPGPVTDMLAAGIFMYMAEMRTVTTLFVKLDSYSPEKNKNLLSLQIHLTTIQKILGEHGGFLRQFLVDDKGCVLIASWGVPGRSYPDNGNRCLAAAVEMRASLQVMDMKTSIGITTGHALCGRVGGKIRSEYAMVGDVINLAARFMGKAKGRIVCDEVTHDLVCKNESTVALFKRLDPMTLKGKERPIAPYVCLAQQGSDMWDTQRQLRMIGRIHLQNSVNAFLDAIDKGDNITNPQPKVVVIEGAHGTGKTMVADRIKKSASQFFRRKVYMYSMVHTLSRVPYAGVKGMLQNIFGLDHLGDDTLAIKTALLKVVRDAYGSAEGTTTEVAINALKVVLGIDLQEETETEIPATATPGMQKKLPLHAVVSVVSELAYHALGEAPVVFVFDNVHLMDKTSWKLLIQLLQCPVRLLLVLTATPVEEDIIKRQNLFRAKQSQAAGEQEPSLRLEPSNLGLHREHGDTHLNMQQYIRATQLPITTKFSLPPFTKPDLRQLLQHTLVPQDKVMITEFVVDTVYGLSGGNPYWCVEVVRFIKEHSVSLFMSHMAMQDGGGIARDGGVKGVKDDNDESSEGSERGTVSAEEEAMMGRMAILVVCRFERLLVEEQSVVRYASVAGPEFSMGLLHAVLPRNIKPQLELIIQALVTARFLVYSRHTYYNFRNSMVHMVLYNLTPASSRKRMHKAFADYYLVKHKGDPLYLPVMTYHLLQAQAETAQAVEFLCKTAAHALVMFCFEDCLEALEKALELVSRKLEIHEMMAVLHYISEMHEMGHTRRLIAPPASISEQGDLDEIQEEEREMSFSHLSNARGAGDDSQEIYRRAFSEPGVRAVQAKRWEGTLGTTPGEVGGAAAHRSDGSPSSAFGENQSGEAASTMGEVGWQKEDVDSAAQKSLGHRIDRLKEATKESHSKLCHAGESCPASRGNFSSRRRRQVGDGCQESLPRYTGYSVRVAPSGRVGGDASLRDPDDEEDDEEDLDDWGEAVDRAPSPRDGNTDCEASSLSLSDGEDGGGGGSVGGGGDGNGKSVNAAPRKIDAVRVRGGSSRLRWGVACLLDARLGRYMLPGAAGPDFLESEEVNFSTSAHRLPPEPDGGDIDPMQAEDEEKAPNSRWTDKLQRHSGRSSFLGLSTLKMKVNIAAMLLSERTPGRVLRRGYSSSSKMSFDSNNVALPPSFLASLAKARRAASQLRPGASEFSNRTVHSQSSEGQDNPPLLRAGGAMRKVVLAPLPFRGTTSVNRRLSDGSVPSYQANQLVGMQPGNVEVGGAVGGAARRLNPLRRKYRQGGDDGRDRDRSSVCVVS